MTKIRVDVEIPIELYDELKARAKNKSVEQFAAELIKEEIGKRIKRVDLIKRIKLEPMSPKKYQIVLRAVDRLNLPFCPRVKITHEMKRDAREAAKKICVADKDLKSTNYTRSALMQHFKGKVGEFAFHQWYSGNYKESYKYFGNFKEPTAFDGAINGDGIDVKAGAPNFLAFNPKAFGLQADRRQLSEAAKKKIAAYVKVLLFNEDLSSKGNQYEVAYIVGYCVREELQQKRGFIPLLDLRVMTYFKPGVYKRPDVPRLRDIPEIKSAIAALAS